ncbi:hypothetical protein JOF41_007384 [Saccharothrix coeruleofusca]|uniref:hypothetical protein n=1 Tax=Saccharothrix coeruleofusca TaxID=33919 RepID=UPI001AE104DC|nr:hypothetical protein [Saccharothrix coeruleofusca]MBP2341130.1 hypothetical protein [Saccharothrix coeruleofusca]
MPSLEDPVAAELARLRARVAALESRRHTALYDGLGNRVFDVEAAPALGIRDLWLMVPFWQRPQAVQATAATDWFGGTSGSAVAVWETNIPKQATALRIRLITGVSAGGTTGAYQVLLNGVAADSWTTSTVGASSSTRFVGLPGAWHAVVNVQVTYARTAGAGNVYCHVQDGYQREA